MPPMKDSDWRGVEALIDKTSKRLGYKMVANKAGAVRQQVDDDFPSRASSVRGSSILSNIDVEYLETLVKSTPAFFESTKGRGKGTRRVPFRRDAWKRVENMISEHADRQGLRLVNAKPMKASIGVDMMAFLGTSRVSSAGIDRVGEAKVKQFISKWFAGDGARYVKTPRRQQFEKAMTDAKARKEKPEEPAAAEEGPSPSLDETPEDLNVPFGGSRAAHRVAMGRQREAMRSLDGQYLDHVKSDDLTALRAAARSYQFAGALSDTGPSKVEGRTMRQAPRYDKAPSLGPGWSAVYSDEFQTVWDNGESLVVAYTGTDSIDDFFPDLKIAAKVPGSYAVSAVGSIEEDPRILAAIEKTGAVIHDTKHRGKRVLFTGHSLGAATSFVAYDKFSQTAVSPTQYRVVGWELPWPMVAGKGPNYIDGERRRAYVMPGDPVSARLVKPGSVFNQKGTFIIIPGSAEEAQKMSSRHSIDTLLKNEEKVSDAHRAETAAVLSAEVEEEVAAVEEDQKQEDVKIPDFVDFGGGVDPGTDEAQKQEDPGVDETPGVKTETSSGLGEGGPDPGAGEEVSTATGDRFRGVPGVGVPAAEPGSGTFGDVVRPELQAAVNAIFHRYGKSFRQYIADFVASRRYAAMKAETGGDGHGGLDRLIANYGSEIGVAPFEHGDLDDASMAVLYAEVAAIVDWFLRNPERLPSRAINRLSVLLETKLFPAPEGTPVDQMTDDQLLAQMATRGAVVKVDPSTGRDRALAAVKDLLPGAGGAPSTAEPHPSGAATGDAAEAPGNVAGQPDEVDDDGVVEIIDEDTFRLDTTKFIDTTGGTATRYDFALPTENGYSLSFATEDDE